MGAGPGWSARGFLSRGWGGDEKFLSKVRLFFFRQGLLKSTSSRVCLNACWAGSGWIPGFFYDGKGFFRFCVQEDLVNFLHARSAQNFSGRVCWKIFKQGLVDRLADFVQGLRGWWKNFGQGPVEIFCSGELIQQFLTLSGLRPATGAPPDAMTTYDVLYYLDIGSTVPAAPSWKIPKASHFSVFSQKKSLNLVLRVFVLSQSINTPYS